MREECFVPGADVPTVAFLLQSFAGQYAVRLEEYEQPLATKEKYGDIQPYYQTWFVSIVRPSLPATGRPSGVQQMSEELGGTVILERTLTGTKIIAEWQELPPPPQKPSRRPARGTAGRTLPTDIRRAGPRILPDTESALRRYSTLMRAWGIRQDDARRAILVDNPWFILKWISYCREQMDSPGSETQSGVHDAIAEAQDKQRSTGGRPTDTANIYAREQFDLGKGIIEVRAEYHRLWKAKDSNLTAESIEKKLGNVYKNWKRVKDKRV